MRICARLLRRWGRLIRPQSSRTSTVANQESMKLVLEPNVAETEVAAEVAVEVEAEAEAEDGVVVPAATKERNE